MAMYVFNTAGDAVGFVFETCIYDFEGTPLGRILGSRVHRMDGSYVGEWFHNMVVERRTTHPRAISAMDPPSSKPGMNSNYHRRPAAEHGRYPDVFDRLHEVDLAAYAAE
jgi:hypothetical protein